MPVKKISAVFITIFKVDHIWNLIGLICSIGGGSQNGIYQFVDMGFGKIEVGHEGCRLFDESSQVLRLDHQKCPVKISGQLIATVAGYVAAAAGKFFDEVVAGLNNRAFREIEVGITALN